MTLATRMSPLPRTAMQQAPVFLKNEAFCFRGGIGMLYFWPFPVFNQDSQK